jgi:hypothetical protein
VCKIFDHCALELRQAEILDQCARFLTTVRGFFLQPASCSHGISHPGSVILRRKKKVHQFIRIRKAPKLLAGSGSGFVTRGYGSGSGFGSETGLKILLKIIQKISNLLIMTLKIHKSYIFFEKFAFKSITSHLKSLALWKSESLGSDQKLDQKLFTSRIRIQNSAENEIRIRKNSYGSTTLVPLRVWLNLVKYFGSRFDYSCFFNTLWPISVEGSGKNYSTIMLWLRL